jgi:hypothetical protein
MNKIVGSIIIAIILLFTLNVKAQNPKKQILGDWVKTKIVDLKSGSLTSGKYSETDSYVKFSFSKSLLYMVSAPFDKGIGIPYVIDNEIIKFAIRPELSLGLINEPEYLIKSISKEEMILYTTNIKKDTICYYFKRLTLMNKEDSIFQFDPIIIKHIHFANGSRKNISCIYKFSATKYDYATPIYDDGSLGYFLGSAINLPKTFPLNKLSNELKVIILINNKGKVLSTDLIGSIDPKTDLEIKNFMKKTKWAVNQPDIDKPIKVIFSLKFQLLLEKSPY